MVQYADDGDGVIAPAVEDLADHLCNRDAGVEFFRHLAGDNGGRDADGFLAVVDGFKIQVFIRPETAPGNQAAAECAEEMFVRHVNGGLHRGLLLFIAEANTTVPGGIHERHLIDHGGVLDAGNCAQCGQIRAGAGGGIVIGAAADQLDAQQLVLQLQQLQGLNRQ